MRSEPKRRQPNTIFTNEPVLPGNNIGTDIEEKKRALVPCVSAFIASREQFDGKDVSVTFFQEGVSSLVCTLETDRKKVIFKMPLGYVHSRGEGRFLKVWEKAGIKVPHVIEEGTIDGHRYILMEYIGAPTIADTHTLDQLIEQKIFKTMGAMLRVMHAPLASGFGRVLEERAEYADFSDWLSNEYLQKEITYVQENNILDETHGSLTAACATLRDFIASENRSSYCHDDFAIYNIFNTDPLTVFDPDVTFNHGYLDLGRSLVILISHYEDSRTWTQMIDGYFQHEQCNKKVLHASIMLNSYAGIRYWHMTNQDKKIKNIQGYLIENKYLLEHE